MCPKCPQTLTLLGQRILRAGVSQGYSATAMSEPMEIRRHGQQCVVRREHDQRVVVGVAWP